MTSDDQVSHGDIYHKMGVLEGKLDAVIVSVAEKKSDLGEAFRRLTDLEKRVAQGVILAVAVGMLAPLLWNAVDPQLHFQQKTPSEVRQ